MNVEDVGASFRGGEKTRLRTVAVANVVENVVELQNLILVQSANVRTGEGHGEGHRFCHAS